jgi:hypothetical protein
MDRLDANSLYDASFTQVGGAREDPRSPSKKETTSYSPSDIDGEPSTSLSQLFKVNRLLQKELDQVKKELDSEKLKTSKLEKQIKSLNL